MEQVKLSRIVMKWRPELYSFLRKDELNSSIVLRDGLESLESDDALEIIQYSIYEHQKDAVIH